MSDDIKTVVEDLGGAFEDFKESHQKNLDEIKKNGVSDPILQEKVEKIADDVSKFAEYKQNLELKEQSIAKAEERLDKLEVAMGRPGVNGDKEVNSKMDIFKGWLRKGEVSPEESKALYESDDSLGGYFAPTEYVEEIIKGVTESSPMREIVRVRTTDKRGIEIPKRENQFSAVFVSENATRSETTGYRTGLLTIDAHELYAMVDISQAMLEDSAFNLESEMASEFAEQFAVAEGTSVVTGNGVGRPTGFTDTSAGVGTTNSGNANTLTANGLYDLIYAVKSDYLRNARFVMNRGTFAKVLQLEDTAGQKVFHVGLNLVSGAPSTIAGFPYTLATDMPDVSAGTKPVAFGDFSRAYVLVDRVNMSIQRDPFTQASSGRIRYIARRRLGGNVVLAEAIRLQNIST